MRLIAEHLTPPVDLDRDHWRRSAPAVVTLVEYGDYECPHSRIAFRVTQRPEEQLGGQLRFAFRRFALTGIHPLALAVALAAAYFAEAAALQGHSGPRTSCCSSTGRRSGSRPVGLRRPSRAGPAAAGGRPGQPLGVAAGPGLGRLSPPRWRVSRLRTLAISAQAHKPSRPGGSA
jgi:hypothetical protein